MATRDIIVVGASAGGVQALTKLVSELPLNLQAAVFIVLHVRADAPSLLPAILSRDAKLPVAHARDGEQIVPGKVYVAPPDQHLLIEDGRVKLVHGPKENLHRPSIDVLFRSAARWGGPRVIGVVLTGARDDGATGMRLIKQRGGIAIVQDPSEAPFPSMPMSVLQTVKVDYSLPLSAISPLLNELSKQTIEEGEYPVPDEIEIESRIAGQNLDASELLASVERIGRISRLTCPDCHGALWEILDDDMLRYRCHVGHAFSADSLSEGQSEMLEVALWSAVRALEEKIISLPELELDQTSEGTGRYISLTIMVMQVEQNAPELAVITATDVTEQIQIKRRLEAVQREHAELVNELSTANKRLGAMNKELQDANEELQAANEELMLTQEELQATNEEFEATNEELQATNEELETNNEELQATNEELQTTNDELTARTVELQEITQQHRHEQLQLAQLLERFPHYVMVLNAADLTVQAVNPGYAEVLKDRGAIGTPLPEIFGGKDMEQLLDLLRNATQQGQSLSSSPINAGVGKDGQPENARFIHTVVPISDETGATVNRLFVYSEKVA